MLTSLRYIYPTLILVAASTATVHAQDAPAETRVITGVVTETGTGVPVAGATVLLKGSSNGAVTEADGSYTLSEVPPGPVTLIVSGHDHETRELAVGPDQRRLDVNLAISTTEEIVVTGRAPQMTKQNLANGASVVQSDELTRVTAQTLDSAVQGKIAGANIQANSGAPGGGVQMRLRGVSTINGSSQPLYVIDGVLVSDAAVASGVYEVTRSGAGSNAARNQDNQVNRIADLNPNDIESIEVLKGASAAALYGSKASNGVVVITTKRGRKGEMKVSVTQRFGTYQVARTLGSRTYDEAAAMSKIGDKAVDYQPGVTYDNERALFRGANLASETSASLSGGSDSTTYYGSLLVRDDPGILKGTFYQKQSGRLAVTHSFGKRFKLSGTANIIHSRGARGLTQNDNAQVSHYIVLAATPSFYDLRRRADGSYPRNPFAGPGTNPLQTVALMDEEEEVWRAIGSLHGNYSLLDTQTQSLSATATLGVDRFNQVNDLLFPPELFFEPADQLDGTSINASSNNLNLNTDVSLIHSYYPRAGWWRAVSSAGFQFEQRALDTLYVTSRNLIAGAANVDSATQVSLDEQHTRINDRGMYVQEELLLLNERLSLLGALRLESSSANGNADRLYAYPKASASYRVPGLAADVELLRTRIAYGQTGNQPLFQHQYTPLVAANSIGGSGGVVVLGELGDSNIKPERQAEIEAGVDLMALSGRAVVEVTGYQKTISDLILQRSLAPSTGYEREFMNGGTLRNRGIELMLQVTPVQTQNFSWVSRNIFTLNRSKVVDLPVPAFITGGFGTNLGAFRIEEGKSATQIVGTVPDEMGGTTVRKIGDVEPTFKLSFVNNLSFGDFALSSLLDWQQGSNVINLTRNIYDGEGNSPDYDTAGRARIERWQQGDARVYVEDGTFLKLREVALHYQLPRTLIASLGPLDNARLSLSGRNLLTFTPYSGLDPEVSNFGNQAIARNIDVAPYPPSRSYWLSLEAGF
jgi:TonB-linked SusC/RagA family outer membrane protein